MEYDSQPLSERELEILELVSTGMTNQQIALQLDISANTVKAHLRNIFGKLGVESRTEATRYAIAHQLVTLPGLAAPADDGEEPQAEPALPRFDATEAYRRVIPAWQQVGVLALAVLAGLAVALWPRSSAQATPSASAFHDGAPSQAAAAWQEAPRWHTETTLPTARSRFAQVALDGRLYLIGGESESGLTGRVDVYDLATGAWEQLAAKPTAVANVKAAAVGGRIYLPGGMLADGLPTDALEVYDRATGQWSQAARLPVALFGYALIADDQGFWLCGGWDGQRYVAETYRYRAADDTWEQGPPLSVARGFAAGALLDGRLYVTGGYDGETVYRLCESLLADDAADAARAWQLRAPMRAARAGHEAVALEGGLYVVGGGWESSLAYGERYDATANAWATFATPLVGAWRNLGLAAASTSRGGFLYAAGGWNDGYLQSVQAYHATYRLYLTVEKGGPDG